MKTRYRLQCCVLALILSSLTSPTQSAEDVPLKSGLYVTRPENCALNKREALKRFGEMIGVEMVRIDGRDVDYIAQLGCWARLADINGDVIRVVQTCKVEDGLNNNDLEYVRISPSAFTYVGVRFDRCPSSGTAN